MDILTVLLIVLVISVVAGAAFALMRSKQRSGSVLAAPEPRSQSGSGPGGER